MFVCSFRGMRMWSMYDAVLPSGALCVHGNLKPIEWFGLKEQAVSATNSPWSWIRSVNCSPFMFVWVRDFAFVHDHPVPWRVKSTCAFVSMHSTGIVLLGSDRINLWMSAQQFADCLDSSVGMYTEAKVRSRNLSVSLTAMALPWSISCTWHVRFFKSDLWMSSITPACLCCMPDFFPEWKIW